MVILNRALTWLHLVLVVSLVSGGLLNTCLEDGGRQIGLVWIFGGVFVV